MDDNDVVDGRNGSDVITDPGPQQGANVVGDGDGTGGRGCGIGMIIGVVVGFDSGDVSPIVANSGAVHHRAFPVFGTGAVANTAGDLRNDAMTAVGQSRVMADTGANGSRARARAC